MPKQTLLDEFETSVGTKIENLTQADAVKTLRLLFARMQVWVDADEELRHRRTHPERVPFVKKTA